MTNTLKPFMFWVAFVASLGGLLFGFDTAVISGAEKQIQQIYGLSDFAHGFTIASALIGTIIGALFCGKPAERLGRLKSLKIIGALYLISAVGSGSASISSSSLQLPIPEYVTTQAYLSCLPSSGKWR